jgi:RNA polymerase sigma-54 factor
MLKQKLQQKLLQKLSPQQIQMIKLLEIPAMQLEQRIKKELEENPVLEEESENEFESSYDDNEDEKDSGDNQDEFTLEDYMEADDTPSYRLSTSNTSKDDKKTDIPFSVGTSFIASLESQLGLRKIDERQQNLALYILGNIDDDGYLRRKIDAMVDDLAFMQNVTTTKEELEEILKIIQDFDPPGVGARDLQECLLLQIIKKDQNQPAVSLADKILKSSFQEFTKKHYDKIIKRHNISEAELKEAIDEILKLNPKPGGSYSDPMSKTLEGIVPDFILDYKDGEFILNLNSRNVPELRLNKTYSEMYENLQSTREGQSKTDKDALTFVKQKIESAKWFIDAIIQRQNTLMLTMNAILDYQKAYFEDGDETKLKPMILKDIAEKTGLDISTISRVANSKYIQTHFGIIPLKFFFSEGLQTESGVEVSTREIKKILEDIISEEDSKKPVTDDQLALILKEKGYHIARRTVAKYREQLNIPVARLRKKLQ